MLLVTLAVKTILSISRNRMDQITIKKQIGNHLNKDVINVSISLSSFCVPGCFQDPRYQFFCSSVMLRQNKSLLAPGQILFKPA